MTAIPTDTDHQDTADTGTTRISPLAIAVFAVALLIGGLLIWLSFAGDDGRPAEHVLQLSTDGDAGTETLISGETVSIPPRPQVLDGDETPSAGDETDTPTQNDNTLPATDGNLQQIGSLPLLTAGASLEGAPIEGLYEETTAGLLPVVATDGRRPVASYGRPFELPLTGDDARPRVAIMIMGFGLNRTFAERALEQLPADISLAFTPYSSELQNQINAARADGHEVALELPMEPFDYPDNDPGPYTLLTNLPAEANRKRLEWLLARTTGYFATVNRQGGRFLSESESLAPIMTALMERGVGFVDTGDGARNATEDAVPEGFNWAVGNRVVDAAKSPRQIDKALADLEEAARDNGMAVGIGTALPITVERVAQWAESLAEKGIDLVPVSAALAHGTSVPAGNDATSQADASGDLNE
ncbi:divergent polysaccharide deacetylase family protein [Pyruvatibacter sp.]